MSKETKMINHDRLVREFHHDFTVREMLDMEVRDLPKFEDGIHHFQVDKSSLHMPIMIWYQNGKLHREDGPASVSPCGDEFWYQNGVRHRTDGPAVWRPNRDSGWWLNGDWLSFDRWIARLAEIDIEHATLMKLQWG